MQVVIFTGGLATRLRPITENVPKSMIIIKGKPFLEYQINLLKRNKIEDIVLCVGHLAEQIKEYFGNGQKFGVKITYSEEKERLLGTGGALMLAKPFLKDIFFTMYGDSYLMLDFGKIMEEFLKFKKKAMMVVFKNNDCFDKSNVSIKDGYVIKFSKNDGDEDIEYIDEGTSIFRREVLNLIPPDKFFHLDDIFMRLIEERELLAYETKQRFYEIGSHRGLEEFAGLIESGIQK